MARAPRARSGRPPASAPAFGSYGVICWSTGLLFVRRTLAVMAGLVPAIHAGPPQDSPASARPAGRRTVARLFALACVDALGLRGWPGQARPCYGAVRHLRHAPDSFPTTAKAIRARILALMALSVGRPVCCSFVEPLPSWPGLSRPSTPGRRKNKSRLGATGRKADGRKAFRACLRRCAGPSWMAGTSPAMTP